jgi:hypothetical protein
MALVHSWDDRIMPRDRERDQRVQSLLRLFPASDLEL